MRGLGTPSLPEGPPALPVFGTDPPVGLGLQLPPPCAQTTVPASSAVSPFPQHRGRPSAPAEEAPPPVPARRGHRAQLSSPRSPRRPALRSVRPLAVLAPGSPASLGRPGVHLCPARVCRSAWESSRHVSGVSLCVTPRGALISGPQCSPQGFSPGLLLRTRLRPLHPASHPPHPHLSEP